MNYIRIYDNLINKARNRVIDAGVYIERHHIIPKCMGGGNESENLVSFTPEEHFLAHQLLVKIHPNESKLIFAANAMSMSCKEKHKKVGSKMYGWLKRRAAKAFSVMNKGVPKTEKTKQLMSLAKLNNPMNQALDENHNAKKISTPYGEFFSIQSCVIFISSILKISIHEAYNYVHRKLDSKHFVEWKRLSNKGIHKTYKPRPLNIDIQRVAKKSRRITDGNVNRYLKPTDSLPSGWSYGWTMNNWNVGGYYWVTNGMNNKQMRKTESVPDGYRMGVTRRGI